MATPVTGELRPLADGWEARVRIDDKGTRRGFALSAIAKTDEGPARERCTAMAQIALRLRKAGHADKVEKLLEMAAKARAGKPWDAVLAAVDALTSGTTEPLSEAARITVAAFGKDWRGGDLHRKYPDHVPAVEHRRNEIVSRLYVDPVIGDRRVSELTLEDAEEVMARIPEGKASSSRRHVAQYVRRLLVLAVYPARLRTSHPIPKGWLPRVKDSKAKECLYPPEDRALLACTSVPLLRRLAYGFLDREGMRTDELASLEWQSVDLERGLVDLTRNKTDDPRSWQLDPGVWRALEIWKKRYCVGAKGTDHVFAELGVTINVDHLAGQLRADLKKAGVTRPQLFERSEHRRPLRAHDLRATMITIALATGKTETWVADRTGHTTSTMINRYRRKARTWNLGPLDPLDEAIPELRPLPHERPTSSATRSNSGHPANENHEESREPMKTTGTDDSLGSTAARRGGSSPSRCTESENTERIATDGDAVERAPHEHGALMGRSAPDEVELALAKAIEAATAAGRFDAVLALAKELEARRVARAAPGVVDLAARKRQR